MRKINFSYQIEYSPIHDFDYRSFENDLIKYDAYLNMESKIKVLASILNKDKFSRRAICFSDGVENPACLTSIQFLIESINSEFISGNILYMICNFRSQHERLGRPSDELMLKFLATKFIENSKFSFDKIEITCNIADYHLY